MKGRYKQFDQELYNANDGPAKCAMKAHLELSGHTVTVPPENQGVDLYSEIGDLVMWHEVEVAAWWKSGKYPWVTGSVPERKLRLASVVTESSLYFWQLRLDLRRTVVLPKYCLQQRFLTMVPNKYVAAGELFFRVPLQLGKEFNLLPL